MAPESHLTVLLPVRNAEDLLPGWLASVAEYADSVIALDDGSTDLTRSILQEHPLVTDVLSNSVRPNYAGWDDLGNRQRLVYSALARGARWLLFLDADERLDHADGQALRQFLESDARSGFAYGFQVFRMVDDEHHYDSRSLWVFRLFSAVDAVTPLGSRRLHFVPVPSGIPRRRWLFTSVRIQHSGGLTRAHRLARFEKYRQADPDNDFQSDYENLLSDPSMVATWPARSSDVPVLLGTEGRYVDRLADAVPEVGTVALSAVMIAQNDVAVIARSIDALLSQEVDDEFEIIVVCSGTDGTFEFVRSSYPTVRSIQLPERALPGEARNAGVWMARGEYLSFPGSHVWLMPGSLQARLSAHDDGWDLVAGSVVNGNTTPAGWASYILDHATKTPARSAGEFQGVPGSASYVTRDVRQVGGFPEGVRAGEDTDVNRKLYFDGKRTYFCPSATFAHASPSTDTAGLLRHHFQRGRALGRILRQTEGRADLVRLRKSLNLPRRRLRTIRNAMDGADRDLRQIYRGRVRFLVAAGAVSAASGAWFQLATREATPRVRLVAPVRPQTTGPVVVLSGRPGEAACGILGSGKSDQVAERLATFTRYAEFVCPVRSALAPIVTSATVTAEHTGTYTIDMRRRTVDAYLSAVRSVGASLLLQVQPGRASLAAVIERWEELLVEPDVGIYLDLRRKVASVGQCDEFKDALSMVRAISGDDTIVLVRGLDTSDPGVIVVSETLDLRRPGTRFPHEALRADPLPQVLVYQ